MKKVILIFVMGLSIGGILCAQEYRTGIGIRGGFASGLTLKHFVNPKLAFEGLLTTRWQGVNLTGLFEIHKQRAFDVKHLVWYYGGGAHLGFYNGNDVSWGRSGAAYTIFGLDGIIGIEYSFIEIPLNLGIDIKPAVNLMGYTGLWPEGAISVRYVF
jgi:hypothetical protein